MKAKPSKTASTKKGARIYAQKGTDDWASIPMSSASAAVTNLLNLEHKDDISDAMRRHVRDGRFADSFMVATNGGSTFERILRPSSEEARELSPKSSPSPPQPGLHNIGSSSPRFVVKNPTLLPCRCVALVKILPETGGEFWGTAWLIGPRTFATAAHNLLHPVHGRTSRMFVSPGYDGIRESGQWYAVKCNRLSQSWLDNPSDKNPHDFAVIRIDEAEVGNRLGWFGFADYADEKFPDFAINAFGYPVNDEPRFTMHGATGRVARPDPDRIYYNCDMAGGMSGSPIFALYGDHRIAVGIHAAADPLGGFVGTRIDAAVFDLFSKYKNW